LRLGERDVPETFKNIMAECNRLQDIHCGEFKASISGSELLANMLRKAKEQGIANPRIYSHSLGYFLQEPIAQTAAKRYLYLTSDAGS
jgi:hypothetical protein